MLQLTMRWLRASIFMLGVILVVFLSGCAAVGGSNQAPSGLNTPVGLENAAAGIDLPITTVTLSPAATLTPTAVRLPTLTLTPQPIRIAAVGDISICGQDGDELTAALLPGSLDAVLILGDSNNEDGLLWQYEKCFAPSWGMFMDRIYPAPGNHDYYEDPLQGYYLYFGERAGQAGKGYYDFKLGDWQLVSLNTNCGYVPCGPASEQALWLEELLSQPQPRCTLAFWHHPRWSSGLAGETYWISTLWDLLYEAGADLVLSGHDHHYERISPVDQTGVVDESDGMRSFIVGTGGASSRGLAEIKPYSAKQVIGQFGVLFLDLYERFYEWQFVNVEGEVLDEGWGGCR